MSQFIRHKRGDSFVFGATLSSDGAVVDMSDWGILAQVRKPSGELVVTLTLEWIDRPLGKYQLSDMSTTDWPIGMLEADIQYTLPSGQVASTETIHIHSLKDVSS